MEMCRRGGRDSEKQIVKIALLITTAIVTKKALDGIN